MNFFDRSSQSGIPRGRRWKIRIRTMSRSTPQSKFDRQTSKHWKRTFFIKFLPVRRKMRFWTGCQSWENISSWQLPIETRKTVARRENPEEGGCEIFPEIFQRIFFRSLNIYISAQILYCLFLLVLQTCECLLIFMSPTYSLY